MAKIPGAVALRILDFDEMYEVNSTGREYRPRDAKKRIKPLTYIRRPAGMIQTEIETEILIVAGPERACRVKGLYYDLVGLAAGKKAEHRGWLLNRRLEPMGAIEIAATKGYPVKQVVEDLEILRCCHLAEWQTCPFASESGQPVSFYVSDDKTSSKKNFSEFSEFSEGLKQNQNFKQNFKTDLVKDIPGTGEGKEAADTPGRGGPVTGPLGGLPAPRPEGLGSGDLGSGGSAEVGGEEGGGSEIGSGGLGSGDLTRAGGGQGADSTNSGTPEGELKNLLSGGGAGYLPLPWREVMKMVESRGNLASEDAALMVEDLSKKNEIIRREQLINRALIWIKKLFPEQLDPGPQCPQKAQEEAKGSETTFIRRLTSLWEVGGERELIEAVRFAQLKHRESARPRSRIRDPVKVIVAEFNRRIAAGRGRKNDRGPPET